MTEELDRVLDEDKELALGDDSDADDAKETEEE